MEASNLLDTVLRRTNGARSLERINDLGKHLCDLVIYIVLVRDVRHTANPWSF